MWLDNSEEVQNHWNRVASHVYLNEARDQKYFSRMDDAVAILSDRIKDAHLEAASYALECAKLDTSLWADMLHASLSEVNWREVAECLLEGVDKRYELV